MSKSLIFFIILFIDSQRGASDSVTDFSVLLDHTGIQNVLSGTLWLKYLSEKQSLIWAGYF